VILVATMLALTLLAASPPAADAAKRCGKVKGSDGWSRQVVTVRVFRGRVSCRVARRVARRLFSDKARFHEGADSATSYWTVRGGWRGGFRMNRWVMRNKRRGARVGGALR
jgi:hypothetical protein